MASAATTSSASKTKAVTPTVTAPPPSRQPAAESSDGKRMFRRMNGEMIELPPDITLMEAVKLELEAMAAEKKLGKGPPPKPVPVVKRDKPPIKKSKEKEFRKKGKKGGKGGKKGPGGKIAKGMLAVGKSKVAQFLASKGLPILAKGIQKLGMLKSNEQTHDDAGAKLKQTEEAVVPPALEGQSKSNAGQVETVSAKPEPVPDPQKAKDKLAESMEENIPRSIEDVDNFKKHKKAQHMATAVMSVVNTDKTKVTSTFGEIEQQPAPAPPTHQPQALPPEEIAPATAPMGLGQGAIAGLQKEHTDVSNFTKDADNKLKEEGVTQEQLDMVDSGDLAEANKEKKGMAKKAKTEPLAVQQFAKKESQKVDSDLKKEEAKERGNLKNKRKQALSNTKQKQEGAKSELEKKREEVTNKINTIYKTAQDNVKKKLGDLETQAMQRFDTGQAAASKEFEDNVKRELDAFKSDRYSGWFGWARKAKDWLLGMEDLPRVKEIFDTNRAAFVTKIDKLVADITADNNRVIQECKDELANAKKQIKEYVDKLGPDLKDVGKKAQEEMNAKLAEMDSFIAEKEEELKNKLKDKQTAAIKAIDEKIEKMKSEMSGALAKLGALLLLAAKKFFTWALEKFGFSLSEIESIINKGAAVLKAIFTKPIQFVKNLINAASMGFQNFAKNFLTHLKNAVFAWLTGSLEGLILPETWDLKGILSIVFQMLGITYQNIRSHLVKLIPEPAVKAMETSFTLVKTLITEGPMAAWEQLKEIAGEMKDAFVDAVKDWIKWKVVEKAVETILSMFIPGAGIIRAIVGIYDTIVFFIQKAKDIMQMISNFLSSIAEIAAGNIGAAAAALENGLARALKLVIDFLARFLRLDGITKKIREVIQNLRGKVDGVIGKVAKWIVDKGKKIFNALTGKKKDQPEAQKPPPEKQDADQAESIYGLKEEYQNEKHEKHNLFIKKSSGKPQLIVASDPRHVESFLSAKLTEINDPACALSDKKKSEIRTLIGDANGIVAQINELTYPLTPPKDSDKLIMRKVNTHLKHLAGVVKKIDQDSTPIPPLVVKPGYSSNKAKYIDLMYLLKDHHRPGTPADDYGGNMSGATPVLRSQRLYPGSWINFHLVNEHLGGLAVDSNLTPTPIDTNNSYKKDFENEMKTRHSNSEVLWMDVNISYRSDGLFPSSITTKGGSMKAEKGKWVPDASKNLNWSSGNIAEPSSTVIYINLLPPLKKDQETLAKYTPLTIDLIKLIASVKPAVVTDKETIIRILTDMATRDADIAKNLSKYTKLIRATPFDYGR
ncbi:MAG: hypothetical protein FD123_875 [Bacteroidetes bacterium]|nr:MAG: hypothetical protein FD123_875 [Bacteroidota bacterium]